MTQLFALLFLLAASCYVGYRVGTANKHGETGNYFCECPHNVNRCPFINKDTDECMYGDESWNSDVREVAL